MIRFGNKYILFVAGASLMTSAESCAEKPAGKPNVLFICVDDLRRELGCYGSEAITPNIDRLANNGILFCNQYVTAPTSGASRYGMLTGLLPASRTDLTNQASERRLSGKPESDRPETMFHQLRRNGYYTVGIGKISHAVDGFIYSYKEEKSDRPELPYSWDEMLFNPGQWKTGWNAFFGFSDGSSRPSMNGQVKPYECADDDVRLPDEYTADLAVAKLEELSKKDQPFCLAVGFFKPHLPFVSPEKYWNMYDEDSISVSPVPDIPEGFDNRTLSSSGEFKSYKKGDEFPSLTHRVSDDYARKIRHAYFSCVSFTDAMVGRVLDALEKTGLADNTIVVLWGDHGWHLGDFRVWGKHTVYETSLASSFIMKVPGYKGGVRTDRIVSSIDIYPTLMELCGIETPSGLDGDSFVCLLDNPEDKSWRDSAYSFYNRGISVRVPDYRLTYYDKKNNDIWMELYRYEPMGMETENIIEEEPETAEQIYTGHLHKQVLKFDKLYKSK